MDKVCSNCGENKAMYCAKCSYKLKSEKDDYKGLLIMISDPRIVINTKGEETLARAYENMAQGMLDKYTPCPTCNGTQRIQTANGNYKTCGDCKDAESESVHKRICLTCTLEEACLFEKPTINRCRHYKKKGGE